MKINEIINEAQINEAQINEAPQGMFSKIGNKMVAGVGNKINKWTGGLIDPEFGTRAAGKLNTGDMANRLYKAFVFQQGQTRQPATVKSVINFLTSQGFPTTKAQAVITNGIRQMQAAKNKPAQVVQAPVAPQPGQYAQANEDASTGTPTAATQTPAAPLQAPAAGQGLGGQLPQKLINQAFMAAAQEAQMAAYKPAQAQAPATAGQQQAAGQQGQGIQMPQGMKIINKDPIVLQYNNQDYGLNDKGGWVHLKSGRVPPESLQAFLSQQHDIAAE